MDADRPFRTMLVADVHDRVGDLGPVDAIVVGGDIAYKADAREYTAARTWLAELAGAAGCSFADVFVVPGNHDVDHAVIMKEAAVRNAQQAIVTAPMERRERELHEQLRDAAAGPALFAPLANYNDFAKEFGCQIYAPDHLFWHQERQLGSASVRLYGLTSTLLSGAQIYRGQKDVKGDLYLSPLQTVLDPLRGVVNVVVCHHPPDWLSDCDHGDEAICNRAALHLFAHKHRQRVHRDRTFARFAAGAVNPDRKESGWEPGYNLLRLDTIEQDGQLMLDIEAHVIMWQSNPDLFRAKLDENKEPVFRHKIVLRRAQQRPTKLALGSELQGLQGAKGLPYESDVATVDGEVAMSEPANRNLVLRFWRLASSQRRDIAYRLKLIDDEDMKLSEPERYGRALLRASERGLLSRLAEELDRMEKHDGE